MKKELITSTILFGLIFSGAMYFSPECSAKSVRLSRKGKKEIYFLDVAASSFDMKQYDLAIEYYNKALEINPRNSETYTKGEMQNTCLGIIKMQ